MRFTMFHLVLIFGTLQCAITQIIPTGGNLQMSVMSNGSADTTNKGLSTAFSNLGKELLANQNRPTNVDIQVRTSGSSAPSATSGNVNAPAMNLQAEPAAQGSVEMEFSGSGKLKMKPGTAPAQDAQISSPSNIASSMNFLGSGKVAPNIGGSVNFNAQPHLTTGGQANEPSKYSVPEGGANPLTSAVQTSQNLGADGKVNGDLGLPTDQEQNPSASLSGQSNGDVNIFTLLMLIGNQLHASNPLGGNFSMDHLLKPDILSPILSELKGITPDLPSIGANINTGLSDNANPTRFNIDPTRFNIDLDKAVQSGTDSKSNDADKLDKLIGEFKFLWDLIKNAYKQIVPAENINFDMGIKSGKINKKKNKKPKSKNKLKSRKGHKCSCRKHEH